jgi:hypothetical protein
VSGSIGDRLEESFISLVNWYLGLSAVTVYGYDRTVYGYLTVVIRPVPVLYCFISQAQRYGTGGFTAVLRIHTVDTDM